MQKIKKKKDFDFIFKYGKSFKDRFLVLKYIKNNKESRVAFIISSKVSKEAVTRNKIRRRLSELIRKRTNLKKTDLIFIALPGMEKVDFSETKGMVEKLLSKIA